MTEKQKPPPKAPSTWRGRPGFEHYGDMKPVSVQPSAGSRLGNWLYGLLTPWKR